MGSKIVNAMMYKYKEPKKWAEMKSRYGVEGVQGNAPRNRGPGDEHRDEQDVYNDLMKAAQNDYDTRRSIEAAAMSGKKKAQNWAEGGLNSLEDVAKANNMFEKMHGRRSGGDFSSASDYAGLTHSLVQRDRNKFNQSIDQRISDAIPEEEATDKIEEDMNKQKELSETAKNAIKFGSDGNMSYDPDAGVQSEEAGNFAKNFSFKVKEQNEANGITGRGAKIGTQAGGLN